jgi:DNA sulfur modification protein DndB
MSLPSFEYILPVIRGIQAGREYYVSMCPVRFFLNSFQVPLEASLSLLYNHRDERAKLVKAVVKQVEVFRCLTEMEKGSLNGRSHKLFTLSIVDRAIITLLSNIRGNEEANRPHSRLKKEKKEE